jgi:hypothetical protein
VVTAYILVRLRSARAAKVARGILDIKGGQQAEESNGQDLWVGVSCDLLIAS